uniref:Cation:proton antiporter n=1 Tax=Archaeoglobus fulgidus TaxID=2234 RepID=A0A7J2TL77_ARCFL
MDVYALIAITLGFSAILALLFRRMGFSEVAGYLTVGIILSLTLSEKLEENKAYLTFLSEVAITLLIFEIGGEIGIEKIKNLSFLPIAVLISELLTSFAVAVFIGTLLELSSTEIFALAVIGSFSSTPVIYKVLEKLGFEEDLKKLMLTILILEDFVALLILILIPNISSGILNFADFIRFFFISVSFAMLLSFLGLMLTRILKTIKPDEVGMVSAISFAFLFSAISKFLGFSPALGAFVAGIVFSSHPRNLEIGEKMKSVREFFLILFFVSLGLESGIFLSFSPTLILIPVLIILCRFLSFTFSNWVFSKRSLEESIRIGFVATSVGEFGMVIVYEALKLGMVGREFLFISAMAIIFGTMISSRLSFKEKYASRIASLVPVKVKLFVDSLSVNIISVIEGKRSLFVKQLALRIFRNVTIVVIASILGSSSIYLFEMVLPELKYAFSLLILASIVSVTFAMAIRTKYHAEDLCELLEEIRGLNPVLRKIFSATVFGFVMLTSINLIFIVAGKFIAGLAEEIFSIAFGHKVIGFMTILVFLLSSYFIYLQIRRFPL